MRAKLKGLDATDTPDGGLASFRPEDAENFVLWITATIGPADGPGEEQFQFRVCTPSWLAAEPLQKGFAFQRHTLLLERWDPDLVERAIGDLCAHTEGADWSEVGGALSRFGLWEFEDYRE